MADIIITLNKYDSIQFKQFKTQSINSIYNLENDPIEIKITKYVSYYLIECTIKGLYFQGWAYKIDLWHNSTFVKNIVEVQ